MPDSDVVRAARRRAHLKGDHRQCGPRCVARRAAEAASVPVSETVTEAVNQFAAAVAGWPEDDPRRVELALCRVWGRMLDAGEGDAWRIGEALTMHMRTLAIEPEHPADVIDEIRARGAARQIEHLAMAARGESLPVRPAQHWVNGAPGALPAADLGKHHEALPVTAVTSGNAKSAAARQISRSLASGGLSRVFDGRHGYAIRMADSNDAASEAGRTLIARRWGPPGTRNLSRSVQTVVEHADLLDDSQRAAIEAAITGEAGDD